MSIVRYRSAKNGQILVYESTPHYDPVTQQNRPTRKYLGREDPETGVFTPSSGRRGRPRETLEEEETPETDKAPDYRALYEEKAEEVRQLQQELEALQNDLAVVCAQRDEQERAIERYEWMLHSISALLKTFRDDV